ncbi:MAG TPA: sulfite exporter TauE/SafE family protein [Verrucomicrobiales bacterium]|nr:sulfite exporter TauE/SafE family protein [Verrucomicrobiales bacterium]
MAPLELLALAASAAAAGLVNAIAGGGTLLTFPALLLTGISPIAANATSTVALLFGIVGSLFGYRRQIAAVRPWLSRFVPVSLAGGLLGGVLLTMGGEKLFSWLVPFLILFATLLFMAQGVFRSFAGLAPAEGGGSPHPRARALAAAVGFQFLVAVYGGYFGAGAGILMLASLGFLGLGNIHEMNGLKTVLGAVINLTAAIYFIASGLIDWPKAGVMTIGAVAGYYLGSHWSQRIPQAFVRRGIIGVGFAITVVLFWRRA